MCTLASILCSSLPVLWVSIICSTVPFMYKYSPLHVQSPLRMFSTLHVQFPCLVPFVYNLLHVQSLHIQSLSCTMSFMFSLLHVQVQSPCIVPMYSPHVQSPLYSPHCTVPFMYNPHAQSPCRIPFVYSPLLYGPLHILSPSYTVSVIYRLFLVQPASSCIVQSFWLATA